jgi:hypothetical protein
MKNVGARWSARSNDVGGQAYNDGAGESALTKSEKNENNVLISFLKLTSPAQSYIVL